MDDYQEDFDLFFENEGLKTLPPFPFLEPSAFDLISLSIDDNKQKSDDQTIDNGKLHLRIGTGSGEKSGSVYFTATRLAKKSRTIFSWIADPEEDKEQTSSLNINLYPFPIQFAPFSSRLMRLGLYQIRILSITKQPSTSSLTLPEDNNFKAQTFPSNRISINIFVQKLKKIEQKALESFYSNLGNCFFSQANSCFFLSTHNCSSLTFSPDEHSENNNFLKLELFLTEVFPKPSSEFKRKRHTKQKNEMDLSLHYFTPELNFMRVDTEKNTECHVFVHNLTQLPRSITLEDFVIDILDVSFGDPEKKEEVTKWTFPLDEEEEEEWKILSKSQDRNLVDSVRPLLSSSKHFPSLHVGIRCRRRIEGKKHADPKKQLNADVDALMEELGII